ncbi:hypothetical protein T459_01202 [Capsicum annuum]|uniref:Uncharacterized protein n=1 Tax=Capsicum annuum TaxID=4072 RepID=A0A1U8F4V1_CAPAN|nr:uncharacterized protein LOC107853946 [Capsicum annuum]KAF3621432.1 putative DNA polymerase eta-like isoform X1 [Capsicum annuum]PHT93320.1 hypothetical protein T459_01202 [Capsicum annuum]
MAISMKHMYIVIVTLGVLSFIFGVVAENKKPATGIAIPGKGIVICKYGSDPTAALGLLSVIFLAASAVAGFTSLFYPYNGKSIPQAVLLRSTSFVIFLNVALGTTGLAAALLLWPTISEQLHITRNIHHNLQTQCPTAKTGLLGGGAFLSLDSALFWLVCLMLANNARDDYFEETTDLKGGPAVDYEADDVIKSA